MFHKILIANRGEIACRIIRTAQRMGIATVAVTSAADGAALHAAMADEAVAIGPAPVAQSYLNADAILDACRRTGADAVHPGYGFLSERASFAQAVADAGLTFIGPNPRAIATMGDKLAAKRLAAAAGVSTVPGHAGLVATAEEACRIADEIGLPVMIKATAGGGGKGMRVAFRSVEVADGFERARSEAAASFGDDSVIIEKFIIDPRHIEIQVIGDKHGHVVHLGERECSIQRRNQKVVEEAPSPLLDEAMRQAMGAQAVALARAVGYDSAGTVEFVAGQDRSFFFLEMNTRLQVEHPVTELVTGIDIVEHMICVAAGEPLDLRQDRIRRHGWAIETRVYAEDPARGFVPSAGRLSRYRPPPDESGPDRVIRIDSGVAEGDTVGVHYDPMIAKLVTWGPDRDAAVAAQVSALDRFVLDGVRHNGPFLSAVMANERWRAGALSTAFIADEFPAGFAVIAPAGGAARLFVAAAVAIDHVLVARRHAVAGAAPPGLDGDHRAVLVGEERFDIGVQAADGLAVTFADGGTMAVQWSWQPGEPLWCGTVDAQAVVVGVASTPDGFMLSHRVHACIVRVLSPQVADLFAFMPAVEAVSERRALLCPMPATLRTIHVREGEAVTAGTALCLVEAMKMETVLRAEHDGVVARIEAQEGDTLGVDAPILFFD